MAWSLKSLAQNITDILKANAPPRIAMGQDPTADPAAFNTQIVDGYGRAYTAPALVAVGGSTASAAPGVTGRLPLDVTFTIDAGMTATVHPLVGGVSVVFTTAAAAAVSATGKVVTLTAKNAPALTDITAMNVLIAASASVSALIGPLVGTGADTFDAALAIAETPLWTTGTIPANAMIVLGNDGYWWPAERDTTGGIKVSQASLIAGEDLTAGRLKVMPKTTNGSGGAAIAASGTAHNAACVVHRLMVSETGGANPVTVYLRDGGAGGTVRTPIYTVAAGGAISLELNLTFGTDCYMTLGGAGTPTAGVTVHSG